MASAAEPVPVENVLADRIYAAVKSSIRTKKVTVASATAMMGVAMAEVEKVRGLSGMEKKELVIYVISKLLDEIPINQADRDDIKAIVTGMLPSVIDAVVSAASGKLSLNTKWCCCK